MSKLNKSVSDFSEKNCCCSTFTLFSKSFMRFQLKLKSCKSVFKIFREEMTEQMSKIRFDMHFYFANFHIRLKLTATKCKIFLKCSILIRCTALLYFFLAFLISSSDQSDHNAFLYVSIVFAILNNHHEIVFFSFLIYEIVFFIKFSVNCRK